MAFRCYDPYNMQTRFLASNETKLQPHYALHPDDRFPNLQTAIQNILLDTTFVGIVEHYTASLCLWEYIAGGRQFVTSDCTTCEQQTLTLSLKHKQEKKTHGVPPHSVRMISNETLRLIEHNMTTMDQQLYQVGLDVFLKQVERVRLETGVDLLCGKKVTTSTTFTNRSNATTTTTTTTALHRNRNPMSSRQKIFEQTRKGNVSLRYTHPVEPTEA
mmetsp:Transcript_10917/g.20160  ORF Transcript_10917/g.20160 Transcript_10917/m.20160 type:complete len:216 (-) Transcript_10917:430-1077(-)